MSESTAMLSRLVAGDDDALRWLRRRAVRRASPRFARWAWRLIEDDFVGDLLLQLTVSAGREGFTLSSSSAAYVDRAISNLCTSYFRRIARVRNDEPLEPDDRASTGLETVGVGLDMRRALLAISPGCRRLIVGKYVHGLSLDELADASSIPAKTANSRLHSCRTRLREIWRKISRPGRQRNDRAGLS